MKNRPPKKLFVVDGRYPDVDAVGAALSGLLPLPLEKRSSDYLGGPYLLHESPSQVVRVMKNYSSFLDDWTVEDEPRSEYVVVIEKYDDGTRFEMIAELPGFRRHSE